MDSPPIIIQAHRKKKKKRDKSDSKTTTISRKKTSRLDSFTERKLDFGQDSAPPSPSAHTVSSLEVSNRYETLALSNASSVVDLNSDSPASNHSNTNLTMTPIVPVITSHPLFPPSSSSISSTTTSASFYGTPASHIHNSLAVMPPHIIPPFPNHAATTTFTSVTTSTTTSLTPSSLITTTTLIYTHGTITHSTPNSNSNPSPSHKSRLSLIIPPPSPPAVTLPQEFRCDYETSNHHLPSTITSISQPPTVISRPSTDTSSATNQYPPSTTIASSRAPSLYPEVLILPPQQKPKRKRPNISDSGSQSSLDFSEKSLRRSKITPTPITDMDAIISAPTSPPPSSSLPPPKPTSPEPQLSHKPPAIHIYAANNNDLIKKLNSQVSSYPTYKFNNTSLICLPKAPQKPPKITQRSSNFSTRPTQSFIPTILSTSDHTS